MSSIKEILDAEDFIWGQDYSIQDTSFDLRPNFPKNFTTGKYNICEQNTNFEKGLDSSGYPQVKYYGASHLAINQFPKGTEVNTKENGGGLIADNWAHMHGAKIKGKKLSTVTNTEVFLNGFEASALNRGGGNVSRVQNNDGSFTIQQFGYDILILNGEDWEAGLDNSSSSSSIVDQMVNRFNTWNALPEQGGVKKLGVWNVSSSKDDLQSLTSSNLAAYNQTYKFGGTLSIYKDFDLQVAYRYISNNNAHLFYSYIYQSDIAKKINPNGKEVWSLWTQEEAINLVNEPWSGTIIYDESGALVNITGAANNESYGYEKSNGLKGDYKWRGVPVPSLMYAAAILAFFWYDGVYNFGDNRGSTNPDHVFTEGGALKIFPNQINNETVRYEAAFGIQDLVVLAELKASLHLDIINESSTSWFFPEFSIDGGNTWLTNDDVLPSSCAINSNPVVKIKYNSLKSEALIVAINPDCNTPNFLFQNVTVRDTDTGVLNSFVLKSNNIYTGRINVSSVEDTEDTEEIDIIDNSEDFTFGRVGYYYGTDYFTLLAQRVGGITEFKFFGQDNITYPTIRTTKLSGVQIKNGLATLSLPSHSITARNSLIQTEYPSKVEILLYDSSGKLIWKLHDTRGGIHPGSSGIDNKRGNNHPDNCHVYAKMETYTCTITNLNTEVDRGIRFEFLNSNIHVIDTDIPSNTTQSFTLDMSSLTNTWLGFKINCNLY
jgi:hypothetical protein